MQLRIDGDTICRKAYLGDSTLIDIVIPEYVRKIDDWAFAQCTRLRTIILPNGIEYIGRNIFAGCDMLERISVYGLNEAYDNITATYISQMLAFAMRFFGHNAFGWIKGIGSDIWFDDWDMHCDSYIKLRDDIGFMPFWAGGEEDYADCEHEKSIYEYNAKKKKVRILLHRLALKDKFPVRADKLEIWKNYLLSSYEPVVDVLKEDDAYVHDDVRICVDEGVITETDMKLLLGELPDKCIELKAIIMNYIEHINDDGDVWDTYNL